MLALAVVVEPDVGRLQVAVDDALGVSVLERPGDVGGDLDRAVHPQPAALGGEQPLDVAAGHVLADDEGVAVLLAGVEDGDDVRVVAELPHRLGLAAGPRLDRRADALGVEQRHRDLAVGGGVVGEVDALAPALAEEAARAVAPGGDLRGDVRGQRLPRPAGSLMRLGAVAKLGSAGVAEPGPLAVLVAAGRTPHRDYLVNRPLGP